MHPVRLPRFDSSQYDAEFPKLELQKPHAQQDVDGLSKDLEALVLEKKDDSKKGEKKQSATDEKSVKTDKRSAAKICDIMNVHQDDIHGLLRVGEQRFVSGSKDGALNLWDFTGKLIKQVYVPLHIDYTQWITALGSYGDKHWLSGTRDGLVDLWDNDGNWKKTLFDASKLTGGQKCKARNMKRVLCLTTFPETSQFLMGSPTRFSTHSSETGAMLRFCKTHHNDWVYSIYPFSTKKIVVVTGPSLDIYERSDSKSIHWQMRASLIREEECTQRQRLFISAVTPLQANPNHLGLSIFDGRVKIYDIANQSPLWEAQEHRERVWTIENIGNSCFASCADDGLIKLWDPRVAKKSVCTLTDKGAEKSRVSVLLTTKEDTQFLSGSCPDDVKRSKQKAKFSFWDLRKQG